MFPFSVPFSFAHAARRVAAGNALAANNLPANLAFAATASTADVLYRLHAHTHGLNREAVLFAREDHGRNELTAAQTAQLRRFAGRSLTMQRLLGMTAASFTQRLASATCHVKRSFSGEKPARAAELVVGDIVRVSSGDFVPADLRLIEATDDLLVDQSVLAGERSVQKKDAERLEEVPANAAACTDLAFAGTTVASGSAWGVVVAVGAETLLARAAGCNATEPAAAAVPAARAVPQLI